ncbi:unnamed protein product [Coregonus sp. 'balchen']|nr:unnamed protein product [Coregonus sp. 'balchen']
MSSVQCPQEDCLASDDVLVHFFNEFLRLPSFPECVQYNKETGVFEVVSDAAGALSRRIRLAKLLSQWGPRSWNQKRDGVSVQHPVTPEPVCPSPGPDDRETLMKVLYVSLGQVSTSWDFFVSLTPGDTFLSVFSVCLQASVTDMLTMAEVKDKQQPVCTQSVKTPVCSLGREGRRGLTSACFSCIPDSESYALSSSLLVPRPLCSSVLDWDRRQGAHSPKQEMRVYLTETEAGTTDQGNGDPNPQNPSCYSGPHTESPCEGGPAISHSRLEEQRG